MFHPPSAVCSRRKKRALMHDFLNTCLTVSTYVSIVGLFFAAWMLRRREPCLSLFFLLSGIIYLSFPVFDLARERNLLTIEAYSLYRKIPGRLLPALLICAFLPCLYYSQRKAKEA